MKPNLVVVRAGKNSLHHDWLALPYDDRNWDLVVSYFDEAAFEAHEDAPGVQAVLIKGGKWDGLFQTFSTFENWRDYTHIWLPDDDIATLGEMINGMFEVAAEHKLAICQPSLTHDSYFSHLLFMQCPGFKLRYTNFIEVMVPCLERDLLEAVLPLFEDTMSGFGLDYLWARLPQAGHNRAAILDEITVHHTRPIGSQLKGRIASSGGSAMDEREDLITRYPTLRGTSPLANGGITADGERLEGRLRMGIAMARAYWEARTGFLDPSLARRKIFQMFKRQLIKKMPLEPVIV